MGKEDLKEKKALNLNAYIFDEVLGNFFIHVTENSFDLYKKVVRTKISDNSTFEDKEFVGAYKELSTCLKRIIGLKLIEKNKKYSLKEYILKYEEISKEILLKIPDIKVC